MGNRRMDAVIRAKRQMTLPREVCEELGIGTGDVLEFSVENGRVIGVPRKVAAMEALKEIQQAFEQSGISEEKLQERGREVRREVARERYGVRA